MYSNLRDEVLALELEQEEAAKRSLQKTTVPPPQKVVKQIQTKDDVVKLAASLPICSDGVFPALVADNDVALQSLTSALLRETVESVRVLVPSIPPSNAGKTRGTTLYCRCVLRHLSLIHI